jgi:predicted DNA-binding WGR domain protein
MRRFELVEGSSSKFWEITLSGASFTVRFGRIGTNGQTQEKSFASAEKAKSEHDTLVTEKTKKGYKEIGSAAPTVAAHVAKPASAASAAGSAGSAPATPAATPKKSKPKAAAVEEVAPVESPVAAPIWVGAPTKIVPTDPSTWPAALREELHPTPLSPGPAISLDRAAIWRRVRERAKASKVSPSKELKAALARAALEPAPTGLADEVTELHMADVLAGSDDPWRDQRALATGLELLVDHWVATGGFVAAVELGFALSRSNRRWLHYGLQTMWLRAASHAAHLSHADRDAAHAQLKKGHQAASTSSGKPDPDSVLAYLFPENGGGDAIVRRGALNNQLQGGSPLAVAAITELDSLRKVAAMPGGGWLLRTGRSWRAASVEPTAFTFVARFGEAALEPLVELLDKEGHNTDVTLGTARAIGLISSRVRGARRAARRQARAGRHAGVRDALARPRARGDRAGRRRAHGGGGERPHAARADAPRRFPRALGGGGPAPARAPGGAGGGAQQDRRGSGGSERR